MYRRFGAPTYDSVAEHKIKWGDYIYFPVGSIPLSIDRRIREPIIQVTVA